MIQPAGLRSIASARRKAVRHARVCAHPERDRGVVWTKRTEPKLKSPLMPPRSGEELKDELESRQESRIMRALEMVEPGTSLREGKDKIVHAPRGALIVIGDSDELVFMFSGGIKLDVDISPSFLYESAKMDG